MAPSVHNALIARLDARLSDAARVPQSRGLFVTLSFAQSLDGSITSRPGAMIQLSNPHSQRLTHDLRSRHNAILVGVNTVLTDDPRLTVRLVEGPNPRPVILDSRLRMPADARVLSQRRDQTVIIATTTDACCDKESRLRAAGAHVVRLPAASDGRVDLPSLLQLLQSQNINSLMVEGGAQVITRFLAARLVDQLILTVCPVLVGGMRGVNASDYHGLDSLPPLTNVRYHSLFGDLIVQADVLVRQELLSQDSSKAAGQGDGDLRELSGESTEAPIHN
jgi:riboflavin-specific deaminase-like protein